MARKRIVITDGSGWIEWFVIWAIIVTGLSGQNSFGQGQEGLEITVGQSRVIEAPWPAARVAVTDPDIANVQILTPRQVLVQARQVGNTDLILWNEEETEVWQRTVRVMMDVGYQQERLESLFPRASLEVDQSGDLIIVKGFLRNADQAKSLDDYLSKIKIQTVNMTSVAGVEQVQLAVKVAEVSRTAIRALGINAIQGGDDFFSGIRPGSFGGGALVPSIGVGPAGATNIQDIEFTTSDFVAPPLVTVFAGFPNADLEFFLQALAENQYLRVLANPTLVALSGEEANFLAGGEFPIPVVQGTMAGVGATSSITIEYKEFGVRLMFRPVVLGDGTIRLETEPEVSDLTDVGAVIIQGFRVPALRTRRAKTTIELKSGQTFAMAGLIKRNDDALASKIPALGDLPILGPLFRSNRYNRGETELVVLVTATLVEPISESADNLLVPGFMHRDPNDWEFFIEGKISGDAYSECQLEQLEQLEQMGLDKLCGPGAWDSYEGSVDRKVY